MKTNYKIIDGIRYDRKILETADRFRQNSRTGRLSQKSAETLLEVARKSKGITPTEISTLLYIKGNYPWVDSAAKWLEEALQSVETSMEGMLNALQKSFRLNIMDWEINLDEAARQEVTSKVKLDQAISRSIHSFLYDASYPESPRKIVKKVAGLNPLDFPTPEAWNVVLTSRIREYMQEGSLRMLPLEGEDPVNLPKNKERVQDNWVFLLRMPTLSDHLFWAITDRMEEHPTYNYGFSL